MELANGKFWVTVLHRTTLIADANCKFEGFPQTILWFHNSLERLAELTETDNTHGYSLLQERIQLKISQRKRPMGQSWWVPNMKILLSSACIVLVASVCDTTHRILPTGISHELWCPEFLLGLPYIGIIDWLPTWLKLVTKSADTMWPKTPISNNMVGLSDKASLQPETGRNGHQGCS